MPNICAVIASAAWRVDMIKISGLTRRFNGFTAVDNLNLDIPPGAMYGFLGPNGAGKTTTLRMLMGLLQPTAGSVEIDGLTVAADPVAVRARVGYLPDEIFLYDYLTGYQFLEFVADIHKLPDSVREPRIKELLEVFGLADAAGDGGSVNLHIGIGFFYNVSDAGRLNVPSASHFVGSDFEIRICGKTDCCRKQADC